MYTPGKIKQAGKKAIQYQLLESQMAYDSKMKSVRLEEFAIKG
jgi:hypothetical protein